MVLGTRVTRGVLSDHLPDDGGALEGNEEESESRPRVNMREERMGMVGRIAVTCDHDFGTCLRIGV